MAAGVLAGGAIRIAVTLPTTVERGHAMANSAVRSAQPATEMKRGVWQVGAVNVTSQHTNGKYGTRRRSAKGRCIWFRTVVRQATYCHKDAGPNPGSVVLPIPVERLTNGPTERCLLKKWQGATRAAPRAAACRVCCATPDTPYTMSRACCAAPRVAAYARRRVKRRRENMQGGGSGRQVRGRAVQVRGYSIRACAW